MSTESVSLFLSFSHSNINLLFYSLGRTGRVGNPGRAISFVDAAENADVVKKIVAICGSCEVEVPEFMVTVAESAGDDAASTNGNGAADGGDDDDEWG